MNRARRVLVTGAAGFVGSHLVERLVEGGYRVRCFVRYTSVPRHGWLDDLPPGVLDALEVVVGDLRDREAVQQAVTSIDVIFHLGALVGIPYSYLHPREVVETNVIGTLNVLMAAREASVGRIVHMSTSEVYGSAQYAPMDERHPLHAQSPYAASKIGAEKLVESFHASYGVHAVIVRPFNIFGPRQSARAVIPSLITQALKGPDLKLGNAATTRDFTFVTDTVEALVRAAESECAPGRIFNVGSGHDISIGDLARTIVRLTGRGEAELQREASRVRPDASEVQRLVADSSLAQGTLGWKPRVTLEDGLRTTIAWIGANLERYRVGRYEI
jgi:dTDP-glucose 4,6-dehydratase